MKIWAKTHVSGVIDPSSHSRRDRQSCIPRILECPLGQTKAPWKPLPACTSGHGADMAARAAARVFSAQPKLHLILPPHGCHLGAAFRHSAFGAPAADSC